MSAPFVLTAAACACACLLSGCAQLAAPGVATPGVATPRVATPRSAALAFDAPGGRQESARFTLAGESAGLRSFTQASSMPTRDATPSSITYSELPGQPAVSSGSLAFDALFALAVNEMKQDSVAAIRDDAYNDGRPIACECFETGEKWHYVWTRDLSYAASLGLAMLDPQRVVNSLEFKLSGYRPGVARPAAAAGSEDGLQVVQDTGSGGSWPVSTDRVSWAFGAAEVLPALAPPARARFAAIALKALANTIENDRIAAFDQRDGLYTGEQSFLDWREQSYGAGIASDLARMASSKALSTNVAHYKAISLAAQLAAEHGQAQAAARYALWAAQLKAAINQRFWLEDAGLYSSLTAAHFDGAALRKYDWLGQSLAIVAGVADGARRARILAAYPHGPMGAPVIFPQQQGVPVYHNRAIWPFVTAYGLDAARIGGNAAVADAAYDSLVRGAALQLSNMENMEWLAGTPQEPVINSRRQLWSVGAYLGMVVRNVFGVSLEPGGVRVAPFITAKLRREMFGASESIALERLRIHGKEVGVRVLLPAALPSAHAADGFYPVAEVRLNGRPVAAPIRWELLAAQNLIEVRLGALDAGAPGITRVTGDPLAADGPLFAPFEAELASVARNARGQATLRIADLRNKPGSVHYQVFRNGKPAAGKVAAGAWTDSAPAGARAHCYSVAAVVATAAAAAANPGLRSHNSAALCDAAGIEIAAGDARVESNRAVGAGAGRVNGHIKDWGRPDDRFAVRGIVLAAPGPYSVQVRYTNHGHALNTGISNGVKLLSVQDARGRTVARRVIQMPHLPEGSAPMYSTPAEVTLAPGSYSIRLDDFYNMSYLSSNSIYGAGGGKAGPLNRVDIYGIRILATQ